ncbi:para-aminobenzoate synthetase/4-amino-4-deoxychorismate lyase [Gracilibacillus halotolerans]|uniref:Para-aminobenzoate synthetase/4-amino-4-deoxychorismate lyase n=1 Tax=Gracilibacillus halotolerans TaxID=74386 RepID=A0A841RS54_9BACI|nr:para-aminobenzoate synthetase/4-amino-4-deoxychorismate lyase [Gracilibacillus halotolerans]
MKSIYLQFDFLNQKPCSFASPIEVLSTTDSNEIPALMEKMNEFKKEGYYLAGYLSYEAAPAFQTNYQVNDKPLIPLLWFGVFDKPRPVKPIQPAAYTTSEWKPLIKKESFIQNIETIQEYIKNKKTEQVNYTTRFEASFEGDAYTFYNQLKKNQSASYSAYLQLGELQILSLSPELFFKIDGKRIITKPMKGTMKRGFSYKEDEELKSLLYSSEKNRYENEMVAKLLKDELSTLVKANTATIEKKFEIETHPTIHQMTSTVSGELKEESSIYDWFRALFPCGSITGSPKVETMQIIKSLEDSPRDVYCGAIGYITPDNRAIFNVPIRTVQIKGNQAIYGSGSGVTSKSEPIQEYYEVIEKTKILTKEQIEFSLLESMRYENGEINHLSDHLARLKESASYFQFTYDQDNVMSEIRRFIATLQDNPPSKIRLLMSDNGKINLEAIPLEKLNSIRSKLSPQPIKKENLFLYHKTTNRSVYEQFDSKLPNGYQTTLLWNEEGHVTEFSIGNLVIEKNGHYYTPPLSDGLLPGVMRGKLLANNTLIEKHIKKEQLLEADQIFLINSVRGWIKVDLKEQEVSLNKTHLLQ